MQDAVPMGGASFMGMSNEVLYVYDLPKDVQMANIHEFYKKNVGDCVPEIKRNPNKLFYTAIVRFNSSNDFRKACDQFQYPVIKGRECRSLPYDRDFASNKNLAANLFVKGLAKTTTNQALHTHFAKVGPVKSVKVSIEENFESRCYGFVQFEKEEDAQKALNELADNELDGYKLIIEKYSARNPTH